MAGLYALLAAVAAVPLLLALAVRYPESAGWTVRWVLRHLPYRVVAHHAGRVPESGGVLLVSNHVSYMDALLVGVACPRRVRFLIMAGPVRHPLLGPLLKWARVVPIEINKGPRAVLGGMRGVFAALEAGEVVCIFPESHLTRTGAMLPFRHGFERIARRAGVPVVPVCIEGMWGSFFGYSGGRVFGGGFRPFREPAHVAFGDPLPPTTTVAEVRRAIRELTGAVQAAWPPLPVHRLFVRQAAKRPFRSCLVDTTASPARRLNYGKAFAGVACIAWWLRPRVGGADCVGLWLPSSVGGALANMALAVLGRTSVNLNYTAGPEAVRSAARQAGLTHVVTSKRFLARMPLDLGPDVTLVPLEEAAAGIPQWRRAAAYLSAVVLPGWFLDRAVLRLGGHGPDGLATIVFSSGSTGDPKGVMLSHRNIATNARSTARAVAVTPADRLVGVLPFFHSFGYTVTIWTPLTAGASAVYHADPRQAKEVGDVCREHRGTVLVATATFLRFYLKRCGVDDFKTLRLLVCGAEKLPVPLQEEFAAKFGLRPQEGYGCTELSPVVSACVPDSTVNELTQVTTKPGAVGQPIPGVAVKVVDPDTGEPLPTGTEGMVLIKGPNVMVGYLHKPKETAEVVRGGWYTTGDVGRLDEDDFLAITGRLARFAKVGGEMVPLERVEEELHTALGSADRLLAVTAVPDERRGERLVVLHLPWAGEVSLRDVCHKLHERGLPNLWLPGERDFFEVPELPVLGSGKLDLRAVKTLALERAK